MASRLTLNREQIAKFVEDVMEDFGLKKSDTIKMLLEEIQRDDEEDDE